mgnify:CR=1 FL=1
MMIYKKWSDANICLHQTKNLDTIYLFLYSLGNCSKKNVEERKESLQNSKRATLCFFTLI